MQNENVVINDFNLHNFLWEESSYFKQHLLLNNLLSIMRSVNATLLLSWNIITRNYQDSKIIIDLSFAITDIAEKLKFCEIIHEVKNFFNHLFICTIFDLRAQTKLMRQFRRNWKALNIKKFNNIIRKHLSKSLSNTSIKRHYIDSYTTTLFQTFEKIAEQSIFSIKFHKGTKLKWFQECIDIIKKT